MSVVVATIACLLLLLPWTLRWLRRLIMEPPMAPQVQLQGRGAFVVTGCSPGGLGFALASALVAWGADDVVVTCRTREKAAAARTALLAEAGARGQTGAEATLHAFPLDLARVSSVDAFCEALAATGLSLHCLINNAGIHLDLLSRLRAPTPSPDPGDPHELMWRVNHLGGADLTASLLPSLLEHAARTGVPARVVNVVSELHRLGSTEQLFQPFTATRASGYGSWTAYGLSKMAVVLWTRHLAALYRERLLCFSLHPGEVYTNVASVGLRDHPWVCAARGALGSVERFVLNTPWEGVQTQLLCATAADVAPMSGAYLRKGSPVRSPTAQVSGQAAARVWEDALSAVQALRAAG